VLDDNVFIVIGSIAINIDLDLELVFLAGLVRTSKS
jgi:hypothetical protein